jgi:GABA(A) receptor-associated protein
MLVGEFKYIIFKHISQVENHGGQEFKAEQTIYLFVGNTSPKTGSMLSEIYESNKEEDGFLYMTYSAENTLGDGSVLRVFHYTE